MKYVNYALIVLAISAVVGSFLDWPPVLIFFLAALGVIPMAGFMGKATEELAVYTGPKLGGLLNATLGNAAELIIAIIAIREGLLTLVLASITGSILGNILHDGITMALAFGQSQQDMKHSRGQGQKRFRFSRTGL